jgi:hypothetical protein
LSALLCSNGRQRTKRVYFTFTLGKLHKRLIIADGTT